MIDLSISQISEKKISNLLLSSVRTKLRNYNPETSHMPFHHRLLGRDRYATFSFIQSMNTSFGISIWEQLAEILGDGAGYQSTRQYDLLGQIDAKTETVINQIHRDLRNANIEPNKQMEFETIKASISPGKPLRDPDSRVDLVINIPQNDGKIQENFFDITSAKPNIKEFVALKLKLLRWTALRLSCEKEAMIVSRLAIPYNPYHPEPYERWTGKGLYDLSVGEILVGEDFWNFVACDEIYEELLDIFGNVGEILRTELDRKFSEFRDLD